MPSSLIRFERKSIYGGVLLGVEAVEGRALNQSETVALARNQSQSVDLGEAFVGLERRRERLGALRLDRTAIACQQLERPIAPKPLCQRDGALIPELIGAQDELRQHGVDLEHAHQERGVRGLQVLTCGDYVGRKSALVSTCMQAPRSSSHGGLRGHPISIRFAYQTGRAAYPAPAA
jgi:hypothetical protein